MENTPQSLESGNLYLLDETFMMDDYQFYGFSK
jgi:hypothetical protein